MSAVDTRSLQRDSLFLFAHIVREGADDGQRLKVRNLSAGGMMAEGPLDVARGDRVTVELRNIGPVTGSVAWVQGERFGIAFENEIDPKTVRAPASVDSTELPHYSRAHRAPAQPTVERDRLRKI